MTVLLALLFAPTQVGDASPLAVSKDFTDSVQWAAIEAVPRINVRTSEGFVGSGAVVAVKDDNAYILTANHVVREGFPIECDFFARASYPARDKFIKGAEVLIKNQVPDLALLRLPLEKPMVDPDSKVPPPPWFVPPILKLAKPGSRPKVFPFSALAVGCDDGYAPKCVADSVENRTLLQRRGNEVAFFWETAAPSRPGRSGGPLLNTSGEIIGVCVARQGSTGFYAYSDEIHAWLKQYGYEWLWNDGVRK